ncbi:MAG: MerR family transcriptional regulator [Deltaproteobacteria bacterium]|nr:MerR family transcriptional regulator [Deltaproteobacteria bacterium]
MSTFVKLTGVSPDLLRAWERRHGLLEPQRTEGGHRAYTEADRRVIERVLELLRTGRSIGEIARLGRSRILAETRAEALAIDSGAAPEALRERLIAAAKRLDEREVQQALDDTFSLTSPLAAVDQVIVPVARRAGDLWATSELSVASEHLLSAALQFRLQKLIELASAGPRRGEPVVCACFPDELHEIGLLVAALNLAGAGQRICYLGRALPPGELDRAIERLEPGAVCLSVARGAILDEHAGAIAAVARKWPGVPFWIGGAGAEAGTKAKAKALTRAGANVWKMERPIGQLHAALTRAPN